VRTIWKYTLDATNEQIIQMPRGARVLSCAMQHGELCIWAFSVGQTILVDRTVQIRGTGHSADGVDAKDFVGTVLMHGGNLVFHVFVKPEGKRDD
jgi:hypothetical protein